jgi:hypothetical protein
MLRAPSTLWSLALSLAAPLFISACREKPAARPEAPPEPFAVGLIGDLPYDATEEAKLPALVADMNRAPLAFSFFDGDIKGGGGLCNDPVYESAGRFFDSFTAPLVYVLGDNEWTDCHRVSNGGFDPLERLAHLRQTMFRSSASFGHRRLAFANGGPDYPENLRFRYGGVMFVGLNVPGSNNNKIDKMSLDPRSARSMDDLRRANEEYEHRDAANRAFLRNAFAQAKRDAALGLMLVIQADVMPEITDGAERARRDVDGYDAFLQALRDEVVRFERPVVLVHGDSHYFKVDKPFLVPGKKTVLENFTRVETFGSPNVFWVKATVDPSDPNLFRFEPRLVVANRETALAPSVADRRETRELMAGVGARP